MKKIKEFLERACVKVRNSLLTILGDIKVFKYPFFAVFDPDDYQVRGRDVETMQALLKPGDILLRGYRHYLDSKFIPQKLGRTWDGKYAGSGWSHGALYVGNSTVIHAVAEGVEEIHLLDFLQCDRVAVLRAPAGTRKACTTAKSLIGTGYDFDFNSGDTAALYCFELVARCYPDIGLGKFAVSKLFGLLKREVYLAQSFFDCSGLKLLYVHNPVSGVESRRFK